MRLTTVSRFSTIPMSLFCMDIPWCEFNLDLRLSGNVNTLAACLLANLSLHGMTYTSPLCTHCMSVPWCSCNAQTIQACQGYLDALSLVLWFFVFTEAEPELPIVNNNPVNDNPVNENLMNDNPMIDPVNDISPEILSILGEEPNVEDIGFGPKINDHVATRWSKILTHGLQNETKKEICNRHIPENLKLAKAPDMNPELLQAASDLVKKRDIYLVENQNQMAKVITCIGDAISLVIEHKEAGRENLLKVLSDAGRLACHVHHAQTMSRRHFIRTCLNKEDSMNIKDLPRDHLLFGSNLSEKRKNMKIINRVGTEMKAPAPRPKPVTENALPTTSRALNWRGPPPPPPPPRRAYPRPNSTAGGRRQQQPPPPTPAPQPQQRQYYQAPRPSRTSRR